MVRWSWQAELPGGTLQCAVCSVQCAAVVWREDDKVLPTEHHRHYEAPALLVAANCPDCNTKPATGFTCQLVEVECNQISQSYSCGQWMVIGKLKFLPESSKKNVKKYSINVDICLGKPRKENHPKYWNRRSCSTAQSYSKSRYWKFLGKYFAPHGADCTECRRIFVWCL